MDHNISDHLVSAVAADQGPGNLLRIVLIVGVLGAVLLAWFLLRGYKNDDRDD
ncbi:hypothetical protein [Streptomyces sp. VRA16 Mangrove soil]|uniref:hypothetical protein n=1 Tax=Streptomyces sp. VRA16 Mangrove soil TaxID=2817434 RepID=UPI001A9FDA40|nr:hypothetical protein [Streptomyces sp. VRA16 Mangrove soil]MBO1333932.1 hypothetical protein [Streptomyces sp. VRA16 Mangrove soil]